MTNAAYIRAFLLWLAVYSVLLYISIRLLDTHTVVGLWPRVIVGLLPMIGTVGVVVAVMQRFRSLDELERRIQAEGIMFAFVTTALLTFSYGFLQRSIGAPLISYFWVFNVLGTTWFAGIVIAKFRYR
jgi:hypothetical protein